MNRKVNVSHLRNNILREIYMVELQLITTNPLLLGRILLDVPPTSGTAPTQSLLIPLTFQLLSNEHSGV